MYIVYELCLILILCTAGKITTAATTTKMISFDCLFHFDVDNSIANQQQHIVTALAIFHEKKMAKFFYSF